MTKGRHRQSRLTWWPVIAVAAVVGIISASGIALAYWRASGTGTGAATTGVAAPVTLSPATPALTLYPGGDTAVALSVSNPNSTALTIASLVLDPTQGAAGFAVDVAHSICDTTALTYTTQTNAGAGWLVPAKAGTTNGTLAINLPNALAMAVDAANACQGAQFTVYLVAGA